MRKARITAHQIIAVIRSVESGRTVKDVYREAGISEATRDNWKSGYGGMEASDIKSCGCQRQDLWSFFAIFNIRCLITSAVRFPPFHLH